MASKDRTSRSSRRHGDTTGPALVSRLQERTWTWMTKSMNELRDIAQEARKAAKRARMLGDKLELQRLAKLAEDGHATVAGVFGRRTR